MALWPKPAHTKLIQVFKEKKNINIVSEVPSLVLELQIYIW